MENYIIWAIVALLLFVVEISTSGFAVICLSFGAIGAAIASFYDIGSKGELIVFSIITFICFIIIRPLALKLFSNKNPSLTTNAEAMIGQTVLVIEDINPAANTGLVKINGETWRATTIDNTNIEKGQKAIIVKIDSTLLIIKII